MTPKEIIEKLKLTFNELVKNADVSAPTTPSAIPPVMPEMNATIKVKTKDGVEMEVTELQIGAIATIQGIPAPLGEYELEDGTIVVIGDNGAIMDIKMVDGSMPPMTEDMGAKFSAFENTTNEKFASYENKFADYETKFASYEIKLNKATQVIEGLLNLTQTLCDTPTGTPDASVKSSSNFKEEKPISYDILFN